MYCIILNTSITGYNSVLLDISIPGYPVCSVLLDISVKEQEIQDGFPLCKY